jgi:GTP cyclohydrolase II
MTEMQHACTPFKSQYGVGTFHCFSWGPHEEDNILALVVDSSDAPARLVRVQSACYTAEIFRSTDCDCHEQLDTSLRRIHAEGGAVVYMLCDGRGAGLLTKVRGLALTASEGMDTADAYHHLGVELDPRDYRRVAVVLQGLGLMDIQLLTNNPRKVEGLLREGIQVTREPLLIPPTADSRPYLAAKQRKLGHMLDVDVA